MDLPTFIRTTGVEQSAQLFGVSVRTVKSWMYGERVPKPKKWPGIVERAKGKVKMTEICSAHEGRAS